MSRFHVAIALSYVLFAILLNSVGAVILQSILTYGVDKPQAATLEAFKDLSIAAASFLVASQLPKFGYRRGLLAGVLIVGAACAIAPLLDRFWALQALFAAIGVAFAVVKIAVYTSVGLLTRDSAGHASLLTTLEGVFMVGVLSGYVLFAAFIDDADPTSSGWMRVYWVLAALAGAIAVLIATSRLDEREARAEGAAPNALREVAAMLKLGIQPLALVFVACVFLYVLIEQALGTWLPTFNKEVVGLSPKLSVQMTLILAGATAVGRFGAGALLKRMSWPVLLSLCLVGSAVLVLAALPLAAAGGAQGVDSWLEAPPAAFVFPLIGVLLGPIYPTLNSVMLSALPKPSHAPMTGLIVVFSALGGTTGSLLTGLAFQKLGGETAFYLTLAPIAALLACMLALHRMRMKRAAG